MDLKTHIGIFVFTTIYFYLYYLLQDGITERYAWFVPLAVSVSCFIAVEALFWLVWFFFVY